MAKGLFTQGVCVLLRQPMPLDEILDRLRMFDCIARQESDDDEAPETLVFDFRPEVGGHLLVTPSVTTWPDDMGDADERPETFVAWSLGQYGPLAFPGCLSRAVDHAMRWDDVQPKVGEHACHVRLMISYVMGSDEDDDDDLPIIPDDYDAMGELRTLMRAVSALLESPDAICYFNPGGEVLRDEAMLRQDLNRAWSLDLPPLDVWSNLRLFIEDDEWVVMDTVGNGQFDVPDLEAVYQASQYAAQEVEDFLRSATLYLLTCDEEVTTGDTADGPGGVTWSALECEQALSDPPRSTIRWLPDDGIAPADHLIDPGMDELDPTDEFDEYDSDDEDFLVDHGLGSESIDDLFEDSDDQDDPPIQPPF